MHYVYILHSEKLDKFYVGETHDIEIRLIRHNEGYYDNKWTKAGKPWTIFYSLPCKSRKQALEIERWGFYFQAFFSYLHSHLTTPTLYQAKL